jgi:hypothetical protein
MKIEIVAYTQRQPSINFSHSRKATRYERKSTGPPSKKAGNEICSRRLGHVVLVTSGHRPARRGLPFGSFDTIRIAPETVLEGSGTGTKPSSFSMATLGAVVRIAIGLPLRSACLTHRCSMAALSPRAKATAAMETPDCWHAPTASALKCALWIRRRRRPVSITCSIVFT